MKPSKLFSDLSSDARLAIIKILDEAQSFTDLKNHAEISSPEISRHIRRLIESELISKRADGKYVLTSSGKLIRSIYLSVEFIAEQAEFFNRHDLSPIPEFLQSRMHMMEGCEIIPLYSAMELMYTEEELDIYWDISENIPPRDNEKGSPDFEIKDNRSIITPNLTQLYHTLMGEQKYYQTVRVLEGINFSVTINGEKGLIALPDLTGKIDRNQYLYGENRNFIEWCKELFLYYWDRATTTSSMK